MFLTLGSSWFYQVGFQWWGKLPLIIFVLRTLIAGAGSPQADTGSSSSRSLIGDESRTTLNARRARIGEFINLDESEDPPPNAVNLVPPEVKAKPAHRLRVRSQARVVGKRRIPSITHAARRSVEGLFLGDLCVILSDM
eukprot:GHVU01143528.1.p1 GENE.GHVU01143528.1~~GHVU01143528.1.p1  ORF type:complete len:139 (-),score=5.85 GHVU01143528.1:575-991(-)